MSMTRRGHLQTLTATLGLTIAGRASAADTSLQGTWTGILEVGNQQLTLRLFIDAKSVELASPDQSNARVAGADVVMDDKRISVSFKPINARFEGVVVDDRHLDGVITQGQPLKIRLTRGEVAEAISEQAWPPLTRNLLNTKRQSAGTPAMGAAWSRGNHSDLLVTGLRSSGATIPVQSGDQWHWGSITKSMTATLCGRLVEAGVIQWDTTIGQALDEEGGPVPQAYRDATLLHLLSHRAGLQPNIAEINDFSLHVADARAERLKYARLALAQKRAGAPGAQNVYSNNGYVVVGAMLEKLTGKAWETLIQKEVFAPLGVKHAGLGAPGEPGRIDQPIGHAVVKGERTPHPPGGPDDDNPVAMGPAGRVHMPLADMLVYLRAHRDRPARFLKPATWDKLHTPHFGDNYALGWFTRKDGRLWHGGSNTLWMAEVLVDPKTGSVSAACANDAADTTQKAIEEVLLSARAASLR